MVGLELYIWRLSDFERHLSVCYFVRNMKIVMTISPLLMAWIV
ncbi:MAG: hypothetical protein Nk1A_3820 [Endomicrobiia bacterium]|nr:MAG: hypothetical protein Nk1A_3820 [Endomicrobiia bacterium]